MRLMPTPYHSVSNIEGPKHGGSIPDSGNNVFRCHSDTTGAPLRAMRSGSALGTHEAGIGPMQVECLSAGRWRRSTPRMTTHQRSRRRAATDAHRSQQRQDPDCHEDDGRDDPHGRDIATTDAPLAMVVVGGHGLDPLMAEERHTDMVRSRRYARQSVRSVSWITERELPRPRSPRSPDCSKTAQAIVAPAVHHHRAGPHPAPTIQT